MINFELNEQRDNDEWVKESSSTPITGYCLGFTWSLVKVYEEFTFERERGKVLRLNP